MVHSVDYHKAYAQVKTGNVTLNGDEYLQLVKTNEKVYLFTVGGEYIHTSHRGIEVINHSTIFDFLFANPTLFPDRIQVWLAMAK
jgi:hypothetical protein